MLYIFKIERISIFIGKVNKSNENIFNPINDNNNLIIYPNNHFYKGNFLNDNYLIKNGNGKYFIKEHSIIIEGNFENDIIKKGKLFYKNEKYFEGNFENNLIKEGFIIKINSKEIIFKGTLNENLEYHGDNIEIISNNLRCIGNFRNGKKQGNFIINNQENNKKYKNIEFKDDILEKVSF